MATVLATLARNFVRAIPTVIGKPTSARTRARSRSAICRGNPEIWVSPRTSRKASSIEIPSTSGAVSLKMAKTALLAVLYTLMRGETIAAAGHSRRARAAPMAVRTPNALAS